MNFRLQSLRHFVTSKSHILLQRIISVRSQQYVGAGEYSASRESETVPDRVKNRENGSESPAAKGTTRPAKDIRFETVPGHIVPAQEHYAKA